MKLTKYSQNRLWESLNHWRVPRDFAEPMYNYLVCGFEPGSFFKGWYANDVRAIVHSHPANSVEALKNLTKWMINCMPPEAWGNHEQIKVWLKMDPATRRDCLETMELIYTEAKEIEMALKGETTHAPFFD